MKTIEFNESELRALIQLIDIAVKSAGLQVSEAAVVLAQKCQNAIGPPTAEEQEIQRSDEIAEAGALEPVEEDSSVA